MKTHPRATPSRETARRPVTGSSVVEAHMVQGNTPNSGGTERIPARWAWHHRTLTKLHDRLAHAYFTPTKQAITPTEMLGLDVADSPPEQGEHENHWAALAAEDDLLFEVDCALQRIRDGLYGFCEETGQPIPLERLRAIPWTRYCRPKVEKETERRLGHPLTHPWKGQVIA